VWNATHSCDARICEASWRMACFLAMLSRLCRTNDPRDANVRCSLRSRRDHEGEILVRECADTKCPHFCFPAHIRIPCMRRTISRSLLLLPRGGPARVTTYPFSLFLSYARHSPWARSNGCWWMVIGYSFVSVITFVRLCACKDETIFLGLN